MLQAEIRKAQIIILNVIDAEILRKLYKELSECMESTKFMPCKLIKKWQANRSQKQGTYFKKRKWNTSC